jgi:vacuolar-type H+-ATPase subunit I/STV1
MIVVMKKATLITRRVEKQDTLRILRKLGVLHVSAIPAHVLPAQEWREKKLNLEKALALIAPAPASDKKDTAGSNLESALTAAKSILDTREAIRSLNEMSENLNDELLRLHDWEGISVADMKAIQDQGYEIRFFEVPPKQLDLIPSEHQAFIIKRTRTLLWVAIVLKAATPLALEFKTLEPPRRGETELEELQAENRSGLRRLHQELGKLGNEAGNLERAVRDANLEIEPKPPQPWAIPKPSPT